MEAAPGHQRAESARPELGGGPTAAQEGKAARCRRSLTAAQWWGVLGTCLLLLPLGTLEAWQRVRLRAWLRSDAEQRLGRVAAAAASAVENPVREVREAFQSSVSKLTDGERLARRTAAFDPGANRRLLDALRVVERRSGGFARLESAGIRLPAGGEGGGEKAAAVFGAGNCGSAPVAGSAGARGGVLLRLAAPLGDASGAEQEAASICAELELDVRRLLDPVRKALPPQASLCLVDDRGAPLWPVRLQGKSKLGGDSLRGCGPEARSGLGARAGPPSTDAIAAYRQIPSLPGGLVVEMPVAAVLAPARELESEVALAGAVALLLGLGIGALGWRAVISPLQSLSRAAAHLAAGVGAEAQVPAGPREIAVIGTYLEQAVRAQRGAETRWERSLEGRARELRESQGFAEILLDSIEHRVFVVDRDYRVLKANAAAVRVFGGELVGKRCYEVFESRSAPCEDCAAQQTFATGRRACEERSERARAGREAIEVETYPVLDADGNVASVLEIARVVSAEKQRQMEKLHQQRMAAFGLVAAGLAHEIGNPLAAIASQLQLAREQPERREETLSVVAREIARMSRMLRELVDFARRRRDEILLVSVNQVVEDVARLLRHDPRARSVRIELRLAPQLPGLRANEDQLFQVLLNLGLNGLDAMPDGGALEFETAARPGWVVVRVRDTGRGIPEPLRDRLFEPFFSTKPPGQGSGLGLFVSRNIVESMGGEIDLEHTDDRGTVFALYLPVGRVGARDS